MLLKIDFLDHSSSSNTNATNSVKLQVLTPASWKRQFRVSMTTLAMCILSVVVISHLVFAFQRRITHLDLTFEGGFVLRLLAMLTEDVQVNSVMFEGSCKQQFNT